MYRKALLGNLRGDFMASDGRQTTNEESEFARGNSGFASADWRKNRTRPGSESLKRVMFSIDRSAMFLRGIEAKPVRTVAQDWGRALSKIRLFVIACDWLGILIRNLRELITYVYRLQVRSIREVMTRAYYYLYAKFSKFKRFLPNQV